MSESASRPGRLEAIDSLRGFIIVVMAIDHASAFVAEQHFSEFWGTPLPDYGDAFSLLTRVVSHLCAPGFFFLMGSGMALFAAARRERGWSESQITRHFLLRGAVLIVVEILVVNPAWVLGSLEAILREGGIAAPPIPGDGGLPYYTQGVLSALGGAMCAAGVLARLGARSSFLIGISMLMVCQALVPDASQAEVLYPAWQRILLIAGHTDHVMVIYPLLPWLGVCLLGVAFGSALRRDANRSFRLVLPVGVAALFVFAATRIIGGFGTHHPLPSSDWMGLLTVTKYPPSLAFLLLSLGANAILLGAMARPPSFAERGLAILRVYGRSPLFFYVVHLYVYALLGLAIPGQTTLAGMYLVWAIGVALLYPACTRYERFKRGRGEASIWRLF